MRLSIISQDNIEAIINYLTVMETVSTNGIAFFDNQYLNFKHFSKEDLDKIKCLELNINALEFDILNKVYEEHKSEASNRYKEYAVENYKLMLQEIFVASDPASWANTLHQIKLLDEFFINDSTVADLVKKRNKLILDIAEIDGFKTDEDILIRYRRIYLQRRLTVYNYCHAQTTVYINHFKIKSPKVASIISDFKSLLDNQEDFAAFKFENIFIEISGLITKSTKAVNSTEDIAKLKKELAEKNAKFEKEFIKKTEIGISDRLNYEKYIKERDALRYLIDTKTKALGYKDQFILTAKSTLGDKKKLTCDCGKYVMSEIGASVADSLWKAVNGKSDEVDWTQTAKSIGVAIIEGGLLAIANGFFGGAVTASHVQKIFKSFHPVPPDPVLEAIGEVKKALENIDKKIDELSAQIERFEFEMKSMLLQLPKELIKEFKTAEAERLIKEIHRELKNSKDISLYIINNGAKAHSRNDLDDLLAHDKKIRKAITTLISLLYGETNLTSLKEPYEISKSPEANTLAYDIIISAKSTNEFFNDFYTTFSTLEKIYKQITEDLFEAYNFTRPIVNKALGICYITYYVGKSTTKQEEISANLYNMQFDDMAITDMLYTLKVQLKEGMMGTNNAILYNLIDGNKNNLADFNFTQSFYLVEKTIERNKEIIKPVRYDYENEKFIYSNSDYWSFLISPFFGDNANDKKYPIYNANENRNPTFFKKRMAIDFDDNVCFVDNKDFKSLHVEVANSDETKHTFIYSFIKGYNEKFECDGTKYTFALPIPFFALEIFAVKKDASQWDLKMDIVNVSNPKDRSTFATQTYIPHAQNELRLLFSKGKNLRIDITEFQKSTGIALKLVCYIYMGGNTRDEFPKLASFNYYDASPNNRNYNIDNKYAFGYIPQEENKNKIVAGQKLNKGQTIVSTEQRYVLKFQDDGNLVLYACNAEIDGDAYWASGIHGKGAFCILNNQGQLFIYNADGEVIWKTSDNKNDATNAYLEMQNDRNIVIYNESKTPKWSSATHKLDYDALGPGEFLTKGQSIKSKNDSRVKLEFTMEGQPVVKYNEKIVWNGIPGNKNAEKLIVDGTGKFKMMDKYGNTLYEYNYSTGIGGFLKITTSINTNFYVELYNKSGSRLYTIAQGRY